MQTYGRSPDGRTACQHPRVQQSPAILALRTHRLPPTTTGTHATCIHQTTPVRLRWPLEKLGAQPQTAHAQTPTVPNAVNEPPTDNPVYRPATNTHDQYDPPIPSTQTPPTTRR